MEQKKGLCQTSPMPAFNHPPKSALQLDAVLHALGDPARLTIVRALADADELPCGEACPDVPASTRSNHFRILRDAGVIRTRKQGVQYLSLLRRADIDERFPGLLASVLRAQTGSG